MWRPCRSVLPITFACLLLSSPQEVRAAGNMPGAAPALDARGGTQLLSSTADPFSDIETAAHAMPAVKAPASVSQAPAHEPPPLTPGEVEIAQYGAYEDNLAYWKLGGYLAVRFDPPFAPPYTIKSIRFASATTDGSPAVFPSVLLCGPGGPRGGPNTSEPLFEIAPYIASSDGVNEVQVGLTVADSGRTFYACVGVPPISGSTPPPDYPFLRMDNVDLEKGNFQNSCVVLAYGTTVFFVDRNLIISMVCELPDAGKIPIASGTNLGANRVSSGIEYSFASPADVRADGTPMPRNSLLRTRLLWRTDTGPWIVADSAGAGRTSIELPTLPGGLGLLLFWATQAVDRSHNGSILSSGVYTVGSTLLGAGSIGRMYDYDEPNGRPNEATPLTAPYGWRDYETSAPAGDKDYYRFSARPGDLISAGGTYIRLEPPSMSLMMVLVDASGKELVRSELDRFGIDYVVPQASTHSRDVAPRPFTLLITDESNLPGSQHAPRMGDLVRTTYSWTLYVGPPFPSANGTNPSESSAIPDVAAVTPLPDGGTRVSFDIAQDEVGYRWTARVFDVRGRLVRTLATESPGSSVITTTWDGRGGRGQRLARGWYFVRLDGPRRSYVARVLRGNSF